MPSLRRRFPGALFAILWIAASMIAGGCAGTSAKTSVATSELPGGSGEDAAAFAEAAAVRAEAERALFARIGADATAAQDAPPESMTLDALRGQVGPGRAVLVYRLAEPQTSLWVITSEEWRRIALPGESAIASKIDTLRWMLARADDATSIHALRSARRLYMMLVASAEPLLRGRRELVIVPDGALWRLPFEALLAEEPNGKGEVPKRGYLIERWAVAYATSAGAAVLEREPILGGVVAVGDPLYAGPGGSTQGPVPAALPSTTLELAVLDQQARQRERVALVGAAATRRRLLSEPLLADAGVIHLAAHAEAVDPEPERSGIWLAADVSGPGYLSAGDIVSLDLRARLVVLTQCETAEEGPMAGQGVQILAGAFFRAGAQQVMLSHWKPLARSSGLLLDRFYRNLLRKGRPASLALAEAKRQLIGKSETRSPFLWAPLVLIEGPAAPR